MQSAQSLWHDSSTLSLIREKPLEQGSKLLVKACFSMISLGTERLVAKGKVPATLFDSMKVPYMQGDFSFPIKYGYSLVGEVLNKGHDLFGKHVHLLHPHQDFCEVEASDVFVIPDGVGLRIASLASNLETAVNAIWDAQVNIGDKVLIVGFGLVGSLVARLVSMIPGTQVYILDTNSRKIELAEQLGFTPFVNADLTFDLAFNCSAAAGGLQSCIENTGFESKIIELSWYGDQSVDIQLGGSFHQQRKQIVSSQVSQLPSSHQGRWDYGRRKETIFNLLKNPIFKHHISQTIKFANVPEYFEKIRKEKIQELGIVIDYQ